METQSAVAKQIYKAEGHATSHTSRHLQRTFLKSHKSLPQKELRAITDNDYAEKLFSLVEGPWALATLSILDPVQIEE